MNSVKDKEKLIFNKNHKDISHLDSIFLFFT